MRSRRPALGDVVGLGAPRSTGKALYLGAMQETVRRRLMVGAAGAAVAIGLLVALVARPSSDEDALDRLPGRDAPTTVPTTEAGETGTGQGELTTTVPPTSAPTTTQPPIDPDRLWLRFNDVGPVDFESDELIDAIEAENEVVLDDLYSVSELSIDEEDGNGFLRQRYVPSAKGTPVVEFAVPFEEADEMWLSYRVYFEPGWEWARGGKLPGLAGGTRPTGGDGGDGTDGFSARLMWRSENRLVVYAYHPDRPDEFGEDFRLSGDIPVGQWLTITQRIAMNSSPETHDGIVEVWIDGEKRLSRTDLRWRTTGDFGIDLLAYSSFYGGSDASWAPDETTFARFDEFRVSTSPRGVEGAPPE